MPLKKAVLEQGGTMWNKKRVLSMALGIAVASSSLAPAAPAYASEVSAKESQENHGAQEKAVEEGKEEAKESTKTDKPAEDAGKEKETAASEEKDEAKGDGEKESESSEKKDEIKGEEDKDSESSDVKDETKGEEEKESESSEKKDEVKGEEEQETEASEEKESEGAEEETKEEESETSSEEENKKDEIKEDEGEGKEEETSKDETTADGSTADVKQEISDEAKDNAENEEVKTENKAEEVEDEKSVKEELTAKEELGEEGEAKEAASTHLAVFAGDVPDIETEKPLDAKDFKKTYSTVKVTAKDGTEYQVEVIPRNLVYFVDSAAGDTSPAYEAVAAEADTLKNDTADAEWSDGAEWGYEGDVKVKSNTDPKDKSDTGFYGAANAANHPISYHFTLDAGTYKITSYHKEWWSQTRPMSMTVSYGDTELKAGNLTASGTNEFTFTLEEAQEITYTINNTGSQAPVVSWIGIAQVEKEAEPEKPEVEVTEALEDNEEVTVRTGAKLEADMEKGRMITVADGWIGGGNSAVDGGAVINDAKRYLKKANFTLYTDFLFYDTHDNTSALLLGNANNHIRLIPRMTKEQGEKAILRVHTGGKDTDYELNTGITTGAWHAIAVLYHEDAGQGSVSLVLDGKTVLDFTEIGFAFSEEAEITAGYGVTYGTGFMRTGNYDNIVIAASTVDEADAAEETEARVEAKKSFRANRIVIDSLDVEKAAANMNGLTFKGFGALDCNSTSALLLDYKAKHPEKYWEMMEILFGGEHPMMQHIKIEMGNDKNNSTGSQACTMRYSTEYPNVSRVTGFQMAADAKKINPNVKVSLLYWCAPGWVGSNRDNIYKWMKNTTLAAYREYGYMLDIIAPGINENRDDPGLLKEFSKRIKNDTEGMISSDASAAGFQSEEEAELFRQIQLIMSDEVGIASCGPQMVSDQELRDAVDIVGYHYNTDDDSQGNFKRLAEEFDKEIWNSEAQATFGSTADRPNNNMVDNADPGTGIGGAGGPLEMANTVIKGFVNSRRTHFVYQPTFGAFYEGTQYNYKDVMAARDPWSGYVNYDAALNIFQHFTKFAVTGWEADTPENDVWRAIPNASKTTATGTNPVNGRNGGDNYMTLAAPDGTAFSIIINNDSGKEKTYALYPNGLELGENAELEVWETRAAEDGDVYNSNYMKCIDTLSPDAEGYYEVTIKPWSIITVTSLDMDAQEEELALPTASEDGRYVLDTDESGKNQDTTDGYLYADDFDYDDMGNVSDYAGGNITESDKSFIDSRGGASGFYPLYTQDVNGTFEAVIKEDGNGVLRMNGQTGGSCWNGGEPATILGDYRWTNYKVSVDFNLNSTNEYLLLGARQRGSAGGGDNKVSMSAYNLALNHNGNWILRRHSAEIAKGTVDISNPSACNVALRVAGDTVTAYIEGEEVYTYVDPNPQLEGRIMLGVGLPGAGWTAGEFDNLKVETVPGYTPYFAMVHDNLHMKKWGGDEAGSDALVYEGSWSHKNQSSSADSQRSRSNTSQVGASVSYEFAGTGFALIGSNDGKSKVNVEVDGEQLYTDAATIATNSHQPFFIVRGLENGDHKVKISLASGNLSVDSFAYIAADETVSSNVDVSELEAILATMENLDESKYDPDSWKAYQEAVQAASGSRFTLQIAQDILADPVVYGADQEGINEVIGHFNGLLDNLLSKDAPVEILSLDSLPKHLSVSVDGTIADIKGGELPATVKVKNVDGTTNDAAEITWKLSGNIGTAFTQAEAVGTVVGGKNLTVKIPVEVLPAGLVYFIDPGTTDTSVYDLYHSFYPDLLNDTNDQISEDGSWGRSAANTKGDTNPQDKLDTGIYSSRPITYTLPLEAGVYTLSAGFKEWWGYERNMSQAISYTLSDGTVRTISGEAIKVASKGSKESTTTFYLPEDTTVTYTVAKTNDQDAVISWLAVEKASVEEDEAWKPIFASNEDNLWGGLLTQGTVTTKEDPEQGEVLHMNAAGTTFAQIDPKAVNLTGRETMTMSFDLKSETADGYFFTVAIGQDNQKYFFMRTNKDATYTAITTGSSGNEQKATANVETYNKWVHVDLAFTPEKIILYMDGVPVSTINKTVMMTDLGKNPKIYLGKSFYSNDKYFAGAFDNIEIYNRARSAEELSLAYQVGQAKKLDGGEYTTESWKVFADALAKAQDVLNDSNAKAQEMNEAKEALAKAMGALTEGVNLTSLMEIVESAKALKEADYLPGSWSALQAALSEAEELLTKEAVTKEERDAAQAKLTKAVEALEKKADKKALDAAIKAAERLTADDYTKESWKKVEDALKTAKALMKEEDAAQEKVDDAADKLKAACDALVKENTEKPGEDDKPGTDNPGEDDKPGTDKPGEDDKPGTDNPGEDDKPGTDKPGEDDKPGTDNPGEDNKPGTDKPGEDDKPGTDKPGEDDKPGTDNPGTTTPPTTSTSNSGRRNRRVYLSNVTTINPETVPLASGAAPTIMTSVITSSTRAGFWKETAAKIWQLQKTDGTYARNEWALLNGKWYLFNDNSTMVQGWANVNGTWYYCDPIEGSMKTGWQQINGKWYYLDPDNGDMKTGKQLIDGKWYEFDAVNGDMLETK